MTENTTTEAEALVLLGLRHALTDATKNLYSVFCSMSHHEDHEKNFLRGVEKNLADYERMRNLVWTLIQKSPPPDPNQWRE